LDYLTSLPHVITQEQDGCNIVHEMVEPLTKPDDDDDEDGE